MRKNIVVYTVLCAEYSERSVSDAHVWEEEEEEEGDIKKRKLCKVQTGDIYCVYI